MWPPKGSRSTGWEPLNWWIVSWFCILHHWLLYNGLSHLGAGGQSSTEQKGHSTDSWGMASWSRKEIVQECQKCLSPSFPSSLPPFLLPSFLYFLALIFVTLLNFQYLVLLEIINHNLYAMENSVFLLMLADSIPDTWKRSVVNNPLFLVVDTYY